MPGGYGTLETRTRFCPKGSKSESADFIALFLVLADTVDEAVTANATFSLLNQDRVSVSFYRRNGTIPVVFSKVGYR